MESPDRIAERSQRTYARLAWLLINGISNFGVGARSAREAGKA